MNEKGKKRCSEQPPTDSSSKSKKKDKSVEVLINCEYFKESFKKAFLKAFEKRIDYHHESGAEILFQPFTICTLPDFIQPNNFLELLKDELLDLTFHEKNNDLYKFHQSDDLKATSSPYIAALRRLLYEDFASWLKELFKIPCSNIVDMSCSLYEYTDVLLCHDDELEGRRIAFILYLVPSWSKDDGGTLDFFSCDAHGQPDKIVRSFIPAWNNFVFFEVSPASFHQVAEVITKDKTRLSVSGWFYGPSFKRPPPYIENIGHLIKPIHVDLELLRSWINPLYLESDIQMQIQDDFQNDSEIELKDFLKEDKYVIVSKALKDHRLQWISKGPANKRHYQVAEEKNLSKPLLECLQILQSEAMFLILSNMTGLTLHELANEVESEEDRNNMKSYANTSCSSKSVTDDKTSLGYSENKKKCINASCSVEVRQWKHGSYTLVYDEDKEAVCSLDATLYFNCQDWIKEYGGFTSYIAKGEDEELLTVIPFPNSLTLVYREQDTLSFVKHINHHNDEHALFQDMSLKYYE